MAGLRFLQRNGIALLALFIALGGTTYAATGFPANIIGAKQLKKGAVTRVKIKNNAVNGAKVANNSLTGADVLESSLGQVPSAAQADSATNATTATDAANAATAASAQTAATAADSTKLAGFAAASYQRRVTGTCGPHKAISAIAADGSVTCVSPVFKISIDAADGASNDNSGPLPNLAIGMACHSPATLIAFVNQGPDPATLNWFFGGTVGLSSDGTTLGTTTPANEKDFAFLGSTIEGQLVFADGAEVMTINLHVADKGSSGCEARGTAQVSP